MNATSLRQPKALLFLLMTETWERFGFYVVQGLLVLYITSHLGFSDDVSFTLSGTFAGLVYISPFLGGYIADKYLGFKQAIIWGGFFLALGYFLLALSTSSFLLYPALGTIIVGNGLFKPNVSSLLGNQYKENDPRRDAGFTFFYIGINIGAVLSGLSGYIRDSYGWNVTFALACIGMLIAMFTFLSGAKYLAPTSHVKHSASLNLSILGCCLLAIFAINFLLEIHALTEWLLPMTGVLLIVFLTVITLKQPGLAQRKLWMLNSLIISSIIFWMLFWQLFIAANLFVERLVDKNLFGIHLTTTVFYASEALFIILLGPLFAKLWQTLGLKNKNPSPILKFVVGIFFAGLCFLTLGMSTLFPNAEHLVNPLWVFLAYLLITIGELCLSPIGLSAVTTLAPANLMGMMMGIWFAATGFAGLFAGMLAKVASVPIGITTNAEKLMIYQTAFLDFAYLAFIVAIVLFFLQLLGRKIIRI